MVGTAGAARTGESSQVEVRHNGSADRFVPQDWTDRFGEAYRLELDAWLTGVASGQIDGPSAWDGYATVEIAEAAVRSIASGRPEPGVTEACPELYLAGSAGPAPVVSG